MKEVLEYSLRHLDMIGDTNHTYGLVEVQEINKLTELSPEEIIAIENARKYKANYVYFRKFAGRPSVAQVYLYDYTNKINIAETELTELHTQLYSSGQVPMFFVFTKKDVRIFNCFEKPAKGKLLKYKPLEVIKLAANLSDALSDREVEKFQAFSGRAFDNGSFWENSSYSASFNSNESAYEKLLQELTQALKDIISQDILPVAIARKVMVISIVVKYLEERVDEKGHRVFPDKFFNRFKEGANKFTDILDKLGAYVELLDYLAEHFNGGIFQLEDEEKSILEKKDLSRFGQFLNGEVDGVQFVLWRLYSFNDLPVELISNIYEEFLGKQPGVVYTPPFLVNFLLDESMPLSNDSTDFKILDPACGSGVFLVGAYRRLIYRWRRKNNWLSPNLNILKSLLKENIYGVDKDKDATNLTVFSLSLALCDELSPLEIWENLKFDNLHEKNILNDDFFNVVSCNSFQKGFDLVIGNPPFEAKLTEAAQNIEDILAPKRRFSDLLDREEHKSLSINLPDNQIALLFLELSVELCKKGGLTCLIQPSGPLLYNNSSFRYRSFLLSKFYTPQIIDFTHISRVLFGNGDVATAAIFIKNEGPKESGLLHVTVRRTKPHKEKLYFELDTYDFNHVPRKLALYDPLIWKSNFLGGVRVHQLAQRLSSYRTLGDFLDSREIEEEWVYSEGFIARENSVDIFELKRLIHKSEVSILDSDENQKLIELTKKCTAEYITGKVGFDPAAFTSKGIKKRYKMHYKFFDGKRDPKIYKAPHLLIKEVIENESGIIPVELLLDEDIVFKSSVFGIHSKSISELQKLEKYLKRNTVNTFYLAAISGRFMVNKSSSILLADIKKIPYPEDLSDMEFNEFEAIILDEFEKYQLEFRRNGEKAKIAIENASQSDLLRFGDIYCKVLRSVFKTISPYSFFETDSFICYPFYFGEKPNIEFDNLEEAENHLEKLSRKNYGVSLRLTRVIRLYEGNVIYLIKPKKLRYWLCSIALRDADETFSDLRKQGY